MPITRFDADETIAVTIEGQHDAGHFLRVWLDQWTIGQHLARLMPLLHETCQWKLLDEFSEAMPWPPKATIENTDDLSNRGRIISITVVYERTPVATTDSDTDVSADRPATPGCG